MRHALLALIFFTLGCAFGCKTDSGQESPEWEGALCENLTDGMICQGVFYKYGSEEFKKNIYGMNKKSIFCIYTQYVNNVKEWKDPHKKCEYEEPKP